MEASEAKSEPVVGSQGFISQFDSLMAPGVIHFNDRFSDAGALLPD